MFDSATEVEVGDTPISRIGTTMHTILYDIYKELEKDQSINIYLNIMFREKKINGEFIFS